jgi:hypothetical protein
MNEKLVELLKDEEIAKEFFAQETIEDAQKFLASKGVEVSAKELEEFGAAVAAQTEAEGEMDDSQLDKVAGGAYIGLDGKLHGNNCPIIPINIPSWFNKFNRLK